MKVAFIGTHGTGKTTLAHELVVKLKKQGIHTEFLEEIARTCPFPINEEVSEKAQEWIILNQYIREIELDNKYEVLVCDRSILDSYVYYCNLFKRKKWVEDFVKEKATDYKLLVKVPINKNYLTEDGIRSVNKKFQKDIDEKFDYLLNKLNIPFQQYENLNSIVNFIKYVRSTI